MAYSVKVTSLAEEQLLQAGLWWSAHRSKAPDLLVEEFAWGLEYLEHAPLTGARVQGRPREFRKLLLRRSRYHLYYSVDEITEQVTILALWHSAKGSGPRL